ncbi:hypothetical protein Daus18300_012269 [Diaporthe australafricana]|uniref:Uncharacterized protein n=1 Tax=Diaporthe australafricana TaxID=127596 RepID=A0ABR3W3E6_9PEZI
MSDHDDKHLIDHNGGLVAALRSVWFYYIACTPCRKVGHRRETRKEAERERGLKARLEMEQPGLYRHPNPENTNEYWMEDIRMGPSLQKRGPNNKNQSQGNANGAGPAAATVDGSHLERGLTNGSSAAFPSNETAGSPTVVAADDLEARTTLSMSVADSTDLEWNHKRYQREDEELWGHQMYNRAGQRLREVITKGRDTAGRLFDTRTGREREITEEERYQFYGAPRNPPVNDYHPPVVSSKPAQKGEFQWMLQPPPPAKVMEGKVPVSRSGSKTSVNSRKTQVSHASKEELGRLVGEKLVKDKIRKGEKPSEAELTVITGPRPNSRRTKTASTMSSIPSQRSTRSRSNTTGSESSDTIYERRRKRRLAKQKAAEEAGSEADDETDDEEQARPERRASQRPKLQTIASSDLASKKSANSEIMRPSKLAPMSEPALAPSPMSKGPLDDITNTANQSPAAASPTAETQLDGKPAAASADSGLAMA